MNLKASTLLKWQPNSNLLSSYFDLHLYILILTLILNPAFALVSINITPNSLAFPSPSSIETCLLSHQNDININFDATILYLINKIHIRQKIKGRKSIRSNHTEVLFFLHYYLLSTRSVLFPTSTIITSPPRSVRTSSIHLEVFKNDCLSAWSKLISEVFHTMGYMESIQFIKAYCNWTNCELSLKTIRVLMN